MTIEQLKSEIKSKFRTLSRFCKIAEIDRVEIQKFFQSARYKMTDEKQERINELYQLVKNYPGVSYTEGEITAEMRLKMRNRIEKRGGMRKFIEDNPEFNLHSVYQIISGNRKKISKTVKKLITKLEL